MSRFSNRQRARGHVKEQQKLVKLDPSIAKKIADKIESMTPAEKAEIDTLSYEERIAWFNNLVYPS